MSLLQTIDETIYFLSSHNFIGSDELLRLVNELNVCYRSDESNSYLNQVNIKQVVDDFLWLLNYLTNDDEFEHLHIMIKYLHGQHCKAEQCAAYKRHHRNRQNTVKNSSFYVNIDLENLPKYQILDKIHCFFAHSNATRTSNRFLLFGCHHNEDYKQPTQEYSNDNMYNFGTLFYYDYAYEEYHRAQCTEVHQKYKNLKDELVNNTISAVNMMQYQNEYIKAKIKLESYYCRKMITKIKQKYQTREVFGYIENGIELQHILSLMMYCNFDVLQYQLSRTYYISEQIKYHNEYFWFAKYLKIAVQEYGTQIKHGTVNKFFHGMIKQLFLPQIMDFESKGVYIYAPLSTSSSMSVALNFVKHNHGLVIQFGNIDEYGTYYHENECRYFATSWLSDYFAEKEYLFLQNKSRINVDNIILCPSGIEMGIVFKALKIIERITIGRCLVLPDIDKDMSELINALLSDRLSTTLDNSLYAAFESLTEYARKLCGVYCKNKIFFNILYYDVSTYYTFLLSLLFRSDFEWINIEVVYVLFPKIEDIHVSGIEGCEEIFGDILSFLNKYKDNDIQTIRISKTLNSKFNLLSVIKKYKQHFNAINWTIIQDEGYDRTMKINKI
eukprot:365160_1